MFPTVNEAYNHLGVPENANKKKRKKKKKRNPDYTIPRLKLKLINISEKVNEEVLKAATKKQKGKSNKTLAKYNEEDPGKIPNKIL